MATAADRSRRRALIAGAVIVGGLGMLGGGTLVEGFRNLAPRQVVVIEAPPALVEEHFEPWYDGHFETESGAAVFRWQPGASEPDNGGAVRIAFPPTETVYIRFRLKLSDNWVGAGPTHLTWPHLLYLTTNLNDRNVGPAWTRTTAYLQPSGRRVMAILQDGQNVNRDFIRRDTPTESRAVNGCNQPPAPGVDCYQSGQQWRNGRFWAAPVDTFTPGQWSTVEAEFQLNSVVNGIGLPDGSISVWTDGTRVIHQTGLIIRTGQNENMEWQYLLIGPWLGNSPTAQALWLDDLTIAAHRSAPLATRVGR